MHLITGTSSATIAIMSLINKHVLMSGTQYFSDEFAINPYMDDTLAIDANKAAAEHAAVRHAFEEAGIKVTRIEPPKGCQDGVYTANWALVRGDTALMSSLPNKRQGEEAYARQILQDLGKKIITAPVRFSGQGDALPCGNLLFMGSQYRTDPAMWDIVADTLGYEVIRLQTVPSTDANGKPITNAVTNWPDSFFYDIDLALSIISPQLIAWCPAAFLPESQAKIRALSIDKIEVSFEEATQGFACNLVSTGETVIMSNRAPKLQAALEAKGLKTITPEVTEIAKGGGYIRCVSLTLDNV